MTMMRLALILGAMMSLAACEGNGVDKTRDYGFDGKPLSKLKAGVWIDPEGCDHWIVDDGAEGYLSARLNPDGTPVCSGTPGEGGVATGRYDTGSRFSRVFGPARDR